MTQGETERRGTTGRRNADRPDVSDYLRALGTDWVSLRGDRSGGSDRTVVGGLLRTPCGTVVAMGRRAATMRERPRDHGTVSSAVAYRTMLRMVRHAEKFGFPILWLLDARPTTADDAHDGLGALLVAMALVRVPTLAVALGGCDRAMLPLLALCDRVVAITYADDEQAPSTPDTFTAANLDACGCADAVVAQPQTCNDGGSAAVCSAILWHLQDLAHYDHAWLRAQRGDRQRLLQPLPLRERALNDYDQR